MEVCFVFSTSWPNEVYFKSTSSLWVVLTPCLPLTIYERRINATNSSKDIYTQTFDAARGTLFYPTISEPNQVLG